MAQPNRKNPFLSKLEDYQLEDEVEEHIRDIESAVQQGQDLKENPVSESNPFSGSGDSANAGINESAKNQGTDSDDFTKIDVEKPSYVNPVVKLDESAKNETNESAYVSPVQENNSEPTAKIEQLSRMAQTLRGKLDPFIYELRPRSQEQTELLVNAVGWIGIVLGCLVLSLCIFIGKLTFKMLWVSLTVAPAVYVVACALFLLAKWYKNLTLYFIYGVLNFSIMLYLLFISLFFIGYSFEARASFSHCAFIALLHIVALCYCFFTHKFVHYNADFLSNNDGSKEVDMVKFAKNLGANVKQNESDPSNV